MVSRNSSHTTLLKALVVGFVTTLAIVAAKELDSTEDVFDESREWIAVRLDGPKMHATFMYYFHRRFGEQCLFDIKKAPGHKHGKNFQAVCKRLSTILSHRQEDGREPSTQLSDQEKEQIRYELSDQEKEQIQYELNDQEKELIRYELCEIYNLPQQYCDRWRVSRLDKKEAASKLKAPLERFIYANKNTVDMTELHKVLDPADWIGYLIYKKNTGVGALFWIDQKLGLPATMVSRKPVLAFREKSAISDIDNEANWLQMREALRKAFVRRKIFASHINGRGSVEPIINDDERRLIPPFCKYYLVPFEEYELDSWSVEELSIEQIGIYFSEAIHELYERPTVRNGVSAASLDGPQSVVAEWRSEADADAIRDADSPLEDTAAVSGPGSIEDDQTADARGDADSLLEDTTAVRGSRSIEDDQTAEGSSTAISTARSHRCCVLS